MCFLYFSTDIVAHKNGGGLGSDPIINQEKNDIPRTIKKEEREAKRDVVLNGMDAEAAALAQEDLEEINKKTEFVGFMPG